MRTFFTKVDKDLLLDWDQLKLIVAVLKPVKDCTLELQKHCATLRQL